MSGGGRVALVGFEDQDNLGLRYLASALHARGHATRIVKIGASTADVTREIVAFQPEVVGVSLIFQYLLPAFRDLVDDLRRAGVTAHVTTGGHYPSFEPGKTLAGIPGLDSVVRFEGEDTLVELADAVVGGGSWTAVPGIAYREGQEIRTSPPRVGRADLDTLPWPDRDDIRYEQQRLPTASILGGRGCPWRCSFCSIVTFYDGNGTKGRRRRDPARIVDEIEHLARDRGVRVLLWQDDDFLSGGRAGVNWAHEIAAEAIRRDLHRTVRWKISCRSDEIKPGVLEPLVEAGLTHVYMGVEAGDDGALLRLNKRLKSDVHLAAGDIIRGLGLSFDFGFMLLEPWSTFDTVLSNLAFLRRFVGDGAAPACFCRTLPYAGTPIADQLAAEGRVDPNDVEADYAFKDPKLDVLYDWLLATFANRNHTASGTVNLLRTLLFESALAFPDSPRDPVRRAAVRGLAAISNRTMIDCVEAAARYLREVERPDPAVLEELAAHHDAVDRRLNGEVAELRRHLEVRAPPRPASPAGPAKRTCCAECDSTSPSLSTSSLGPCPSIARSVDHNPASPASSSSVASS
jgi:anaerobic magnesium-protoporphyrin IX monomethyl ester cyclase